jgi:hypothetical protein
MFAISGKIYDWQAKDVKGKTLVSITLYKKRKDKDYKYNFVTFSEKITDRLKERVLTNGDTVEIKFFIKCREYNERWYTDLYADEVLLIKKGKQFSHNIFQSNSKFLQGE